MANKKRYNVRKQSLNIVLGGILIMSLVNALSYFGLFFMPSLIFNTFTIFSSLFLLSEVDFFNKIKSKSSRKNIKPADWMIISVSLIGLLSSGLNLLGISLELLKNFQGLVNFFITIFVGIELFRRN